MSHLPETHVHTMKAGLWIHERKPLQLKSHGRHEQSLFRLQYQRSPRNLGSIWRSDTIPTVSHPHGYQTSLLRHDPRRDRPERSPNDRHLRNPRPLGLLARPQPSRRIDPRLRDRRETPERMRLRSRRNPRRRSRPRCRLWLWRYDSVPQRALPRLAHHRPEHRPTPTRSRRHPRHTAT